MKKVSALLALSAVLLSVLSVAPSGAATPLSAAGFSFLPPVVAAGGSDVVVLSNRDVSPIIIGHTFTTDVAICLGTDLEGNPVQVQCNTGIVPRGGTGSVTLFVNAGTPNKPGIYQFYCSIHRIFGMVGLIRIG